MFSPEPLHISGYPEHLWDRLHAGSSASGDNPTKRDLESSRVNTSLKSTAVNVPNWGWINHPPWVPLLCSKSLWPTLWTQEHRELLTKIPKTRPVENSSWPEVPNLFGTRDWFHGGQFFHGPIWRGWFQNAHYINCVSIIIEMLFIYFYFYYYCISSTLDHQALDFGGWGHLL